MSTRNLSSFFRPRSICVIGASDRAHSVGRVVAENVASFGFTGEMFGVNPHAGFSGFPVVPDIHHLAEAPDLAVICTPALTVPGLLAELGARGTKAAVVISAGFGGAEGHKLRDAMLEAARPHLLRIIGPNGIGVISTAGRVNASFAHIAPRQGKLALVTQSGAILTTVLDWATARGIGFSHLVSLGDMADVDFGDMLDYLATDPDTSSIILYAEAVTQARKFMSAARAAARLKPVIAIKSGRHPAAAKAASSHTGALAGADAVYEAAFRRAGILRVDSLDEVFDAIETLGTGFVPAGERLAILTNGGGVGVLATDTLLELGGTLAELSSDSTARLNAVLPAGWSHGNPVDIIGDAPPERYVAALQVLFEAPEVDSILVINCPTAVSSSTDAARAVVAASAAAKRPVLTNWLGSGAAREARAMFAEAGLPTYETPDQAVTGFMHLVRYRRAQAALMEVPPAALAGDAPDRNTVRSIVQTAVDGGGSWLQPEDVATVLKSYGIPGVRTVAAADPRSASLAAQDMAGPVALKIISPDILHKSDAGGVVLNVSQSAVEGAAEAMWQRVGKTQPQARLTGILVQEMVSRPQAHELIVGMTVDPTFGPVLLFGRGGTAVEVINDTTLAFPPLNMNLARYVVQRTRVFRELQGYRDHKPADIGAICGVLVKLANLVGDFEEIVELDINPLLADETGVIALDARIRVASTSSTAGKRLAIRPYPTELEMDVAVPGIGKARMSPVRPEDAADFNAFFARLTPEDVRLRFFSLWRSIPSRQLARLTQIDYDREMAFVLRELPGGDIAGVVRIAADPNNERAEFAVIVRSDLKGHGLGAFLLNHAIDYARGRGIGELFGDILRENHNMMMLARRLHFSLTPTEHAPDVIRARLPLIGQA
jgi:acetyltransferase